MNDARLEVLRRMARERPEDARLRFGLAVELLNKGEIREGAEALRAYLALAEDEGNAWARLGSALAGLGEIEEARDAFRRGIRIASRRGHDALVEEMEEALEDLG
ncbi:MAG: tetratricopeptide repeat protein [Longimicrobiales bacterium]